MKQVKGAVCNDCLHLSDQCNLKLNRKIVVINTEGVPIYALLSLK